MLIDSAADTIYRRDDIADPVIKIFQVLELLAGRIHRMNPSQTIIDRIIRVLRHNTIAEFDKRLLPSLVILDTLHV